MIAALDISVPVSRILDGKGNRGITVGQQTNITVYGQSPLLSDACTRRASWGLCDLRSPPPQGCSAQAQRSVREPHDEGRGNEGQISQHGS